MCYSIDYNDSYYWTKGDWKDSLPWPFSLLCTSNSIIYSSPNQYIWSAITEMWRWRQRFTSLVCLSSLVSLSFTSVMFPSLSKPLFFHFVDLSTLTVRTRNVRNFHKTWINHQSYFIDLHEVPLQKREGDDKGLNNYKPCLSFFISFSLFHICHILFI